MTRTNRTTRINPITRSVGVSITLAALGYLAVPRPAAADIILRAATANPATRPEVRLRWSVSGKDWLPDGGFNVYRIEKGVRKKLNEAPIAPADPRATKTIALGSATTLTNRPFNYGDVLTKARTRPPGVQDADLVVVQPPIARPPSSAAVFDAMATRIKTLNKIKGPGLSAQELDTQLGQAPELKSYYSKLQPVQPRILKIREQPTEADRVRQARLTLITSALVYPEVAHAAGLAYEDASVENGTRYQYALRTVANGAESPTDAATVEITVGADPQPPAPSGLKAMEHDADTVDLRWDRLPQDEEKPFGMVSYNILRTDPGAAQGVRVNKLPVVVGSLEVAGGYVEPASFFRDHPAPVGTLNYQVVMTDMFGRQSPPASISFEMEEWHAPPPPHGIYAEYANGAATITWTRSEPDPASVPKSAAGKPILYHIYRVDIEKRPITIDLISTEPFHGLFAPGVAQSMKAVMALVPQARPLFAATRYGTEAPTHAVMFGKSRKADPAITARMTADQFMTKAAAPGQTAAPGQVEGAKQVAAAIQSGFLSFTDSNPPKDHYYRYLVTAQYETSARESVPLFSERIPVPLDTPPAAPASLKFTFGPPQKDSATVSEAVILKGAGGRGKSIATEASRRGVANWTTSSEFRKKSFTRIENPNRAPDIGGTLVLSWDPVQGTRPMTYRVYRANASFYFLPAPSKAVAPPGESAGRTDSRRMLERTGRMVAGGDDRTSPHGAINLKQLASSGGMAIIGTEAYSLLGQTQDDGTAAGSLTFEEDLPQSQAHYYQYRVVPVNRWGVPGTPKDLLVRVPATVPPTSPGLQMVAANLTGSVDISVTPDDPNEEVVKYHIFRMAVPLSLIEANANKGGTGTASVPTKGTLLASSGPVHSARTGTESFSADPINNNAAGGQLAITGAAAGARTIGAGGLRAPATVTKLGDVTLGAHGAFTEAVGAGASRFGTVRHAAASAVLAGELAKGKVAGSLLTLLTGTGWTEIAALPAPAVSGIGQNAAGDVTTRDTTAQPQVEYLYRVTAEDSDGLMSAPSSPMDATPLRVKCDPPGPVTLSASTDPKHKSAVIVTWGASPTPGLLGYIIKRSVQPAQGAAGPAIQLSGILQQPAATFTDFTALPGNVYNYQVFALDNSGNLSDPSSAAVTR